MEKLNPHHVPLDPMLVEASAGTGKTWTITALYLRLLLERELPVCSILAVTFTRAATSELRDRIRRRVRDALAATAGTTTDDDFANEYIARRNRGAHDAELLQRALSQLDEAPIATLHSFCQRVLTEHAFDVGGPLELEVSTETGVTPAERWAHERFLRGVAGDPLMCAKLAGYGKKVSDIALFADRWPDLAVRCVNDQPLRDAVVSVIALREPFRAAYDAASSLVRQDPTVLTRYVQSLDVKKSCTLYKESAFAGEYLLRPVEEAEATPLPKAIEQLEQAVLLDILKKGSSFRDHPIRKAAEKVVLAHRALSAAAERLSHAFVLDTARTAPKAISDTERAEQYLSFDDLLSRLHAALIGPNGDYLAEKLRRAYRAALVDEFQDTDPVQYAIVRRIFSGADASLFLVGDPKQAIYGFRGADIHSYLEAVGEVPARRSLAISQRSDPPLVEALNTLFGRAKEPFAEPRIQYRPVEAKKGARAQLTIGKETPPALRLVALSTPSDAYTSDAAQEAMRTETIRDLVRLLDGSARIDGKEVRPSDIAVLMRSNADADAMHQALRDAGIPGVLATENSVLDTDEAVELAQVLAAIVQPHNTRAVRTALTTTIIGRSANDLQRLDADETAQWQVVIERLVLAQNKWRERGLYPAFRSILDGEGVAQRLLAQERGDRRLANLLHLGEVLHDVGRRYGMGPEALLAWFEVARRDEDQRAEVAVEAQQVRLETDADAVRVSTIHKTKGLEFPVVIVPSLWRSHIVDAPLIKVPPSGKGKPHLRLCVEKAHPDETADVSARRAEESREQMRIAYVALTRARHQVHVYVPNCEVFDTSALAKLLGVDAKIADAEPAQRHALIERAVTSLARASKHVSAETRAIDETPTPRWSRDVKDDATTIVAAPAPKLSRDHFRVASFSQLIAKGHFEPATTSEEKEAIREIDDPAELVTPPSVGLPVPLASFPRGRDAGDLVHGVLEHLDFTTATVDVIRGVAVTQMKRTRFDVSLASTLAAALHHVLDTTIAARFKLRDIAPSKCIAELEFLLPVIDADVGKARYVGTAMLGETLERHGSELHRRYAARARKLGFEAWEGFLQGFIDLVVEHDGKFYVVDYKSNHLGDTTAAYVPRLLEDVMVKHDYVLQYLLYCVALHRHLRDRLPDYRYEEHFGGALYLFVRGMTPASHTGVFYDLPSADLIEGLSQLLRGVV